MRKEVERMKRYGLIGIVLLALLAMAATPAMAGDQLLKNTTTGVEAWFKNIDEKVKEDVTDAFLMKYYVTSTIKIELYGLDPDQAYTWYVVERYSNRVEKIGSFKDKAAEVIEFPASDLYAGKFYFKLANRTQEVFNSSLEQPNGYSNGSYIWVYKTAIPTITVNVKTPTVVAGDRAKINIVAEDLRSGDKVLWWVEGPYNESACNVNTGPCYVPTSGVRANVGSGPGKVDVTVWVNTSEFFDYANGTYGVYRVKAVILDSAN
ncbi:MAG: hypothetical protein QXN92_07135, partial [Archaeoglobaceae archaeon]